MTALEELARAVLEGRVHVLATTRYERGAVVSTDYAVSVKPPYTPISERWEPTR